jgi:tetratricopeptide (TPR) repeat protein
MQTAARINRFLIDVFSFSKEACSQGVISPSEFYQQIASEIIKGVYRKQALIDVAERLIALADNAYAFRKMDVIERASQILMNLPLHQQYEKIGQYYQALVIKRQGRFAEARALFDRVAEDAPLRYRARAMLAIGASFYQRADSKSALPFYNEANRVAAHNNWCDPLSTAISQRMIAVLKSMNGNHRGALGDLKSMLPLARMVGSVYPYDYYNHLNSLAVELTEAGELEEAEQACRITLASPYASAYPEYRETWDDIQARGCRTSRSVVAFTQRALKTENILRLPAPERGDSFGQAVSSLDASQQSARILDYVEWKNKMVKEPNGTSQDDKPSEKLDDREKMLRIFQLVSQPDRTGQELGDILKAVEKIVSKPKGKGKQ